MPANPSQDKFECRNCGCKQSRVRQTEIIERHYRGRCMTRIKRRRVCRRCGIEYTTVEFPVQEESNRKEIPKDSVMRDVYDYGRSVGHVEVINATGALDREIPLPDNPLAKLTASDTSPTEARPAKSRTPARLKSPKRGK